MSHKIQYSANQSIYNDNYFKYVSISYKVAILLLKCLRASGYTI